MTALDHETLKPCTQPETINHEMFNPEPETEKAILNPEPETRPEILNHGPKYEIFNPEPKHEIPNPDLKISMKYPATNLKPVLNWANVCSPEHTSDTSTNYDSFLN